jgi:hypothetical protein
MKGHVTGDRPRRSDKQPGHGTMVAGVLRQGGPGSPLISRRIAESHNHFEENAIIEALGDLRDAGCAVVVVSFGGEEVGIFSKLRKGIRQYTEAGGTVYAAAGNPHPEDGTTRYDVAPAMYEFVVAVAGGPTFAHHPAGDPGWSGTDCYGWSNGGKWVDYIIPVKRSEGELFSAYLRKRRKDRFAAARGTSLLTPLVAAQIVSGSAKNAYEDKRVRRLPAPPAAVDPFVTCRRR